MNARLKALALAGSAAAAAAAAKGIEAGAEASRGLALHLLEAEAHATARHGETPSVGSVGICRTCRRELPPVRDPVGVHPVAYVLEHERAGHLRRLPETPPSHLLEARA